MRGYGGVRSGSTGTSHWPGLLTSYLEYRTCHRTRAKLDPKEAARRKAEEGRAEAKAARMAKQAEGTRKISSFFTAGAKKK